MEKSIRGGATGTWMGNSAELGMSVCSSKKQGLFLPENVDDIRTTVMKKENMAATWRKLMNKRWS